MKILLAMQDVVHVHGVEIALAQREVVDGIEQVGLAHSVGPGEAVHLRTQVHFDLPVVAEMQQIEAGQVEAHERRQR